MLFAHQNLRENQQEFITTVTTALENKTNALIHAPTGTGKTAAVLAPTLTYAKEHKKTVVFITPRHTQHTIALETIQATQDKHKTMVRTANIVGKKHLCAHPGVQDFSGVEFGEYCKNHIKNGTCDQYKQIKTNNRLSLNAKLALNECVHNIITAEKIKEIAKKNHVCPYEIAMLNGKEAVCIIADYNHMLNPNIRDLLLKKLEKNLGDIILVIDEAHNLPNKARELLSVKISDFIIKAAATQATKLGYKEIGEDILKLNAILEVLVKKISFEKTESLLTKEDFKELLHKEFSDVDEFMGNCIFVAEQAPEAKQKSYLASIVNFLTSWQGPDEGFVRCIKRGFSKKNKPTINIQYNCLDPALLIQPLAERTHSIIAMSGTLTPLEMYKDVLNIPAYTTELHNPFPAENKLTMVIPDTTTKYTKRSPEMFAKIAYYCTQVINNVPGNAIIFFPSYKLRDEIKPFIEKDCTKTSFSEVRGMTKEQKQELLEKFKTYKKTGAVLLAAAAGNFGEGVDLKGDFLKAVVVVGIPLTKPDVQTQALINYYDQKYNKGWEYGYTMPAIIKTLQNAGRCIRSETDKGIVVLIDERYMWQNYKKGLSGEQNICATKRPQELINNFFQYG